MNAFEAVRGVWVLLGVLGVAVGLPAAWVRADVQAEPGVALTIYSTARPGAVRPELYNPSLAPGVHYRPVYPVPGYAVVRQQRGITVETGPSEVRFADVAAKIDPTTVSFASLTDPQGTTVLEQNYEFDLVSPEKLLSKYLDKTITLVRDVGQDSVETISGTLLSADAGYLVLRSDDSTHPIQIVSRAQRVRSIGFAELPGGLITKPTLVWLLHAERGGEHLARVTYQTSGVTWWADYNLTFAEGKSANSGLLDVGAWVSIVNQSGASYADAGLKLIAGDVHRAPVPQPSPRDARMRESFALEESGVAGFEEKAFFEYHMYTLGRRTTLPDNSTKQLELFPPALGVPCEKVLVYYGLPEAARWSYFGEPRLDRDLGTQTNKKVDVYLRFKNDKQAGLGVPLPSGRVRVSKLDVADGSLEFIGEDVIDHTPKDEKVLIKLGSAFDVVGERKQTDFQRERWQRQLEESFEIRIRNHKDEAVKVIVKENLYRWLNWQIVKSSHEYEKADARTVHWLVTVEADGEAVVTYTVRYTW